MVDGTLLRHAFADICRGYSSILGPEGQTLYIRHLGHREHVDYEDMEARFEAAARAQGAPTEKERLDYLFARGEWSQAKENDIARQRDYIQRLEEGRKTIPLPSIMRSQEEQIAKARDDLAKLLLARAQALGITVEMHAKRLIEDHYLVHNIFTDKDFTTPYITDADFDNMGDAEVDALQNLYVRALEPFSDENMKRLAVQSYFTAYWGLCGDNAQAFFGRAVCDLTYYQVRLAHQGRYWKVLMESVDLAKLTPEQRADPDAIEARYITQKNATQLQMDGKVPNVGVTAEDAKEMGLDKQFMKPPPKEMSGVELVNWLRKNQR